MDNSGNLIQYSNCPVCSSPHILPFSEIKDFSVSQRSFAVVSCNTCGLKFTQNVPDAEAIVPYYAFTDYVSHNDTRDGIINNLYQRVKKFTIRQKVAMINALVYEKKGTLLDIGCGTGSFLEAMQADGWRIEGIEPDAGARKLATEKTGISIYGTERLTRMEPGSFDVITLWHVMEHVHGLQEYVKNVAKLLAPGGLLIVAVPNYTSFDAGYYGNYWAAWDVPRHLYHFSPNAMRAFMHQHHFQPLLIKPMWFDSFYVSMLSEKYKNGSLIRGGFVGLWSNICALVNKDKCSSLIYINKKL